MRLSVEINRVSAQHALEELLRRNRRIDNTLDTSWKESLHGSVLSNTAGFFGDLGVGFDIRPELSGRFLSNPDAVLADAKANFVAVWKAKEENITRWQLIRQAILDLSNLHEAPGILSGLRAVDDFLSGYPPGFGNLISIVATDLAEPKKARIKFCCKVPAGCTSADFVETFKWLTLGGRITNLQNDRALIKLFDLVHGVDSRDDDGDYPFGKTVSLDRYIHRTELAKTGMPPQVAPCSVCFSLAGDNPEPTAKLIIGAKYNSRTDREMAEGIDKFLQEQKWPRSFDSYAELVQNCFPGVILDNRSEKLHTCVCLPCKDTGSDEWTLQTYYNPLYLSKIMRSSSGGRSWMRNSPLRSDRARRLRCCRAVVWKSSNLPIKLSRTARDCWAAIDSAVRP